MLRSILGFKWKPSPAHLLLLSKLLSPKSEADFSKADTWQVALGEPPAKAIKRFHDEGMLEKPTLAEMLDYKYKVTDLKRLLKERGLLVSGRKDDLVARVVEADNEGMREAVAGLTLYKCSQAGTAIAQEYVSQEKEKRISAEQKALEMLQKRNFGEAARVVASYEAEQVFARGFNIDWKNYNTSRDVAMLTTIFDVKPKQLASLSDSQLEQVRLHAGMMHLWGYSYADYPFPTEFQAGLAIDNHTIVRTMLSSAYYHMEMMQCFKSQAEFRDVQHVVRIFNCNDNLVCDECKKIGKEYSNLKQVPELPYEKCTCEDGCRCWISWSTSTISR